MSENIHLQYEASISVPSGNDSIKKEIKTPFNIKFSDIEQIFIEESDSIMKRMSIYPNGCVVYFENTAEYAKIRTNFPIKTDENGNLVIVELKE